MDPIRQLFDILVVSTALFLIIRILASELVIKASRNPIITLALGFLITTIGWLALLGLSLLFQGYNPINLSDPAIWALVLLAMVIMAAFFTPNNWQRSLLFLFLGAWVILLGILAVIGLSMVDRWYVEKYAMTWLLLSLTLSLILQVILRILASRYPGP